MLEFKNSGMGVADVDQKSGVVVGYAASFNNKDSYEDIIVPGAFKRTLNNNPGRVKVLMHHDISLLVGKPIKMTEDEKGLRTESHISKTALGRDLMTMIEDEVMTDMSIGFKTIQQEVEEEKEYTRYLKELALKEYSFVTWGANDQALVTGMKGAEAVAFMYKQMDRVAKHLRDGDYITDELPAYLEFCLKGWSERLRVLEEKAQEVGAEDDSVESVMDSTTLNEADSETTPPVDDSVGSGDSEVSTPDERLADDIRRHLEQKRLAEQILTIIDRK